MKTKVDKNKNGDSDSEVSGWRNLLSNSCCSILMESANGEVVLHYHKIV